MVSALDIAREIGNDGDLARKAKVVAFNDLPGVPEGTAGRVAVVGGWDKWIRYHVLFDNGVGLSSINRGDLAPRKDYDAFVEKRRTAIESGAFDVVEADPSAEGGAAEAGGDAGGGAVVNGVEIPGHLLERSKSARERLGA